MSRKKYDAVVKVGEYTNAAGETKSKWMNVGAVIQTDNGHCLLLDRTFNPAGMPDPEGRGTVMVSLFEPQQRQAPRQQAPQSTPPADDPDDDVPF